MLIDFSKIEEVRVPNFKGGEKELLKKAYADGRNCIMLDRLMPGASIGRHTHETNSEIMYIVSGTATFTVGDHPLPDPQLSMQHSGSQRQHLLF